MQTFEDLDRKYPTKFVGKVFQDMQSYISPNGKNNFILVQSHLSGVKFEALHYLLEPPSSLTIKKAVITGTDISKAYKEIPIDEFFGILNKLYGYFNNVEEQDLKSLVADNLSMLNKVFFNSNDEHNYWQHITGVFQNGNPDVCLICNEYIFEINECMGSQLILNKDRFTSREQLNDFMELDITSLRKAIDDFTTITQL